MRKNDLAGRSFHSWQALHFSHVGAGNKQYWQCRCKCGEEKPVESYNLTSGRSKSCRKCSAALATRDIMRTHGMSRTTVYRRWQAMKTRCCNENAKDYKHYGALGVTVHIPWLHDFEAFYAHIGDPPSDLYTVDRINPFGNYEPGNVRWATQAQQAANRRKAYARLTKT